MQVMASLKFDSFEYTYDISKKVIINIVDNCIIDYKSPS